MGLTLREQLANLPVPSLVTVLRVSVPLYDESVAYEKAVELVRAWWNEKAAPYDVFIQSGDRDVSFSRSGFKAEYARTEDSFALAMEEPDSAVEGRSWIVDIALRRENGQSAFSLRGSYRQPYNSKNRPEPRAPRFLRQIIEEVGALDVWPLSSTSQVIDASGLPYFMELLESSDRSLPVVVVSEDIQTGLTLTDPDKLARFLAGTAHVVRIDREASWGLTSQWGAEWSVYLGAIRCYLPRFDREEDKSRHRLWLPEGITRLDANSRNGFINASIGHVFTQITAEFEPWPLLTPSFVRREVTETARVQTETPTKASVSVGEAAVPDAAPADSTYSPPKSPSEVTLTDSERDVRRITELDELVGELTRRLQRQSEIDLKLEEDLEQERAGRAATERRLGEVESELKMIWEDNERLERQKALAFGDSSKEKSESLRPLWQSFSGLFNAMETMAIQFRRMEADSERAYELERELDSAKQANINHKATIDSLNRRNLVQSAIGNAGEFIFRNELLEVVPQIARKQLTLSAILDAVSILFPDRVTVLESASESAEQAASFQYGEQAFDLIWTLATKYWQEIQANGNVEARKLFGKSYAAREKSVLSKLGKERRTFTYNSGPILMEKHLKIGTADNSSDTLRIHFEWLAEEKRIVIGHCGKHLDF
jgi:hypothetical protein